MVDDEHAVLRLPIAIDREDEGCNALDPRSRDPEMEQVGDGGQTLGQVSIFGRPYMARSR